MRNTSATGMTLLDKPEADGSLEDRLDGRALPAIYCTAQQIIHHKVWREEFYVIIVLSSYNSY